MSAREQGAFGATALRLGPLASAALVGLAFYAAGRACIALPRDETRLAPMWFSNAFALAALLRADLRRWPAIVTACVIANLGVSWTAQGRWDAILSVSAANLVEYLGGAVVLRRLMGPEAQLRDGGDLLILALVASIASALSAVVAGVLLWATRGVAVVPVMRAWLMGHPLSLLLLTPCLLILSDAPKHLARTPLTVKALLALTILFACSILVFSQRAAPILFLVPPALLFVGMEFGVLGAALGILMVAVIATIGTLLGKGPISLTHGAFLEREAVLQLFLVTSLFASLPIAALRSREQDIRRAATKEAERARLAEEAAAASEARYRLLADKATDMIVTSNMRGEFEYLSPSVLALSGYHPDELLGSTVAAYVRPEDFAKLRRIMGELAAGVREPGAPIEYKLRRKDGVWVWMESNPKPVRDAQGVPIQFVDIARDITARKAMEADLEAARREAEAAAAAKAEFLANMSHELRTPLTAVLGFAGLVAEQPELSDASRRYLDRIRTAGKSLLATVNDVLDFSRLEAGQVDITPWPTSAADLSREALEMFGGQAREKGLALTLEASTPLPELVEIDADRTRQVLLNLLANAVKFTEAGGVTLRVSHDGERLVLEVADTGPGMTPEGQALLFQRFSQVDASSTRRHGGSGLGLAICKGLADAMGGDISVRSAVGVGSTFRFSLPAPTPAAAAEPERSPAPAAPAAPAAAAPGALRGRILVADDSLANRELATALMAGMGLEIDSVGDGIAAVLATADRAYDVILMDLRMPGLDGRAAAGVIRSGAGPNAATPIIAFSSDVQAEPDALFDAVLLKPLTPGSLLAVLTQALQATGRDRGIKVELHVAA